MKTLQLILYNIAMITATLIKGFATTAGLIMAIGLQNAFVLKQGLKKHHLFLTAFTCFICDSFLIVFGVLGLGLVFESLPLFESVLRWGGALFLVGYAIQSWKSALRPEALVADLEKTANPSKWATLIPLLGFTFLNPHTYIDTFVLLGNVGAQCTIDERPLFILGALSASFIWFFSLAYGASMLSPLFKAPRTWQILNTVMGIVMLGIALSLIWPKI